MLADDACIDAYKLQSLDATVVDSIEHLNSVGGKCFYLRARGVLLDLLDSVHYKPYYLRHDISLPWHTRRKTLSKVRQIYAFLSNQEYQTHYEALLYP